VDDFTDDEGPGVGLAEMITTVRSELLRAQADPRFSALPFTTGPVELELTLAVTKTTHGKGGVRVWVVDAGGEMGRSGATTHSFKVTLTPTDPMTGASAQVARSSTQRASSE
jgi:hypothetical protein